MSDRGYKVIYKSRESDSTDDQLSPQRSRRDDRYQNDDYDVRRNRDPISARSVRGSAVDGGRSNRELTKTTYEVGRDRNSDAYVRGGNVMVIDQPRRRRGESESEWEVIQPEKNSDGAYVIDMGSEGGGRRGGRRYEYEVEMPGRRNDPEPSDYGRRSRAAEVLAPPTRRDRSMSRGMVEAMQQVHVTEDSSEDDRRSRKSVRGRSMVDINTTAATNGVGRRRAPSAFRHDHSPSSDTKRRSRSICFRDDQVIHHDATECRHERPGTEAHVAGMYLVGHRGEFIGRDGEEGSVVRGVRRSRTEEYDRYGQEVERKRQTGYYRDDKYSNDNYERESVYESQKPPRRHRHHHKRRDDDNDSRYSDYYEKKTKKYY